MALIFVLIDGVGLAPAAPYNPVAAGLPRLMRVLGAPLTHALAVRSAMTHAAPIDATLGVDGLPQSGSGHAAIYGGYNAAAANGRHQPTYPTVAMRESLARHNVFLAATQAGCRVAWANAYLPGYEEAIARRRLRHTAGTWAALAAGLELRGVDHVAAGTALTWDITQQLARTRPGATQLPAIAAGEAGARLARLARAHNLVAFETYVPDLAAHGRLSMPLEEALDQVDGLLAGVVAAMSHADTLVVTSDHGNSEDTRTRAHTRNPVPLLAIGAAADRFQAVCSIDQVAGAILHALAQG